MPSAILLSGGLDSAVLLAEEAVAGEVQPIYVSVGLAWERSEREMIGRLLAHPLYAAIERPLAVLGVDMRDVYPQSHWAMTGRAPGYHTPDEDVYLAGRNIVLLSKAGVHCAASNLDRIVVGTLAHNPFPDATPDFRAAMARVLSIGLDRVIAIDAPYAEASKVDVIHRGAKLGIPFELTLSCMQPVLPARPGAPPQHCGTCSKCRERHDAFLQACGSDPTGYVDQRFVRDQ